MIFTDLNLLLLLPTPSYFFFVSASSRSRRIVLIRAISFRVLRSWLGSSSFSVTAWLRRSNRCLVFSSTSRRRSSAPLSRNSFSLAFMILCLLLYCRLHTADCRLPTHLRHRVPSRHPSSCRVGFCGT